MKTQWSNTEVEQAVAKYAALGINADIALRVYSSRLLGADSRLVMHGGGNTSVKTQVVDLIGEVHDVLCVKGSGWDLATIEPAGLPAVGLHALRKLEQRDQLSDEEMVAFQRAHLLDASSPNPSVETLLHAFLPHTFIDHTHAIAILSVTDQLDGEHRCRDIFGTRMGFVPFIMPGFLLAKKAAEIYRQQPEVEGLILHKHGIFTFGETAKQAYERMIEMVDLAEQVLASPTNHLQPNQGLPKNIAEISDVAPIIRGACAQNDACRTIVDFRSSDEILRYVNGVELDRYSQQGVVTPDHIIRTKNRPLLVPAPQAGELIVFQQRVRQAVADYTQAYQKYFTRENSKDQIDRTMLDPMPRVVLIPSLGLLGLGASKKDAMIAADLAVNTIQCIKDAEGIGQFDALPEQELFAMEYWSLEQAKLGSKKEAPLARQVALITGAAGAIGMATARLFAAQGASLVLLDKDGDAVAKLANEFGIRAIGVACNVCDDKDVEHAFAAACEYFGGVDIVVSNAGAAWQGAIGTLDESILRQSFELNFFAHQRVAQRAVEIMLTQKTGGALLFNASKQAVNPGANFGAYGLPKAATLLLSRQYALEYGADGIRSNAVNADRIRSGLLDSAMISKRAEARGISEETYMAGNLLGQEVTADDVAQAFYHQALAMKTTAGVTTVDGGNIAAALR